MTEKSPLDSIWIDGVPFNFSKIKIGSQVAFYQSDQFDNYLAGFVTGILQNNRLHIRVFDPNGASIRKRVNRFDQDEKDSLKYRWLPLSVAHALEEL